MFTLGSLFSGIGGIDLAFSWAGFNVRWQVEIEPFCQAVLRKHAPAYWPNARIHDDVTKITGAELGSVDVMVGGFPCQDISIAGSRKGISKDTRSGLWVEFARLIGEIRPNIVMLENVAAITTLGGTQVIGDLTALGYDAEWGVIPASAVGAPHRRERWWCVAYAERGRRYIGRGKREDSANGDQGRIQTIGGVNTSQAERLGESSMGDPECERLARFTVSSMGSSSIAAEASNGQSQSILGRAVDGLSRRLDGARWPNRPGEAQAEWEAPRTTTEKVKDRAKRLKALGNAVVPQVVYPLAVAIREYLEISQR